MKVHEALAAELKREAVSIEKMLERLPEDALGWKPHPRSTTLGELAAHMAGLVSWVPTSLATTEMDLAAPKNNTTRQAAADGLLATWRKQLQQALEGLGGSTDESMNEMVTLRAGEKVLAVLPRKVLIRNLVLNHIIHHRGQLSVYLRLLDVPVPSIYGPSADEQIF